MLWIHVERIINRLIPLNDAHVKVVDDVREQFWQLYRDLKLYKLDPTAPRPKTLNCVFKRCAALNGLCAAQPSLKRMGNNQQELKPYLPLHNNLSERDIRDHQKTKNQR